MQLMFNSLRGRLLAAFFVFTFIILLVASSSLWFYNQSSKLSELTISIEGVLTKILQMIKYEQDFFNYETINPQFFRSAQSEYIEKHELLLEEVQNDLNSLLEEGQIATLQVDAVFLQDHLEDIIYNLDNYEKSFQKLIQLTLQRGFKDDGVVGKMRANIHKVEDLDYGISQSNILMLRRHEKDYIIRKDTLYAVKLEVLCQKLIQSVAKNPTLSEAQKSEVGGLLKNYLTFFRKMEALESLMGNNNKSGERGKMRKHADQAANAMEEFLLEINKNVLALKNGQFYLFITVTLLAILMSVLFSYVLASRITKPLVHLSGVIQDTVARDFEGISGHVENNSIDEVGELTRNFNLMLSEIQHRLREVREKTHELEQQNEELNSINAQILQSEERLTRLNSVKDKFFSIISHDLRGPLNTILGFMKILEKHCDGFSPQEMQNFALDTQRAVKRLIDLLENLLQWSLSETGDLEYRPRALKLDELIRENIELYHKTAQEKGICFQEEVDYRAYVRADPNMVNFVLRNLFSNAIKFSNRNSMIRIKGQEIDEVIEIKVSDEGIGIEPEILEKLLSSEDHITTLGTDQEKGTGFGLLLCKNFVERNKGSLQIWSELGRGTSVTFTLEKA